MRTLKALVELYKSCRVNTQTLKLSPNSCFCLPPSTHAKLESFCIPFRHDSLIEINRNIDN